ncbi:hypothetical protein [Enterocloster bolteae]|nr:hypothetical protein [Enterocloster bolteae]
MIAFGVLIVMIIGTKKGSILNVGVC